MSVVKEQYSERYIERIEEAVVRVVDDMDLNALTQYAVQQMSDYYKHTAPDKEVEEFLSDNEPLPF